MTPNRKDPQALSALGFTVGGLWERKREEPHDADSHDADDGANAECHPQIPKILEGSVTEAKSTTGRPMASKQRRPGPSSPATSHALVWRRAVTRS